eukprot:TRINITY_DN45960_c0_g1_i1.p1 TRINITY_DN45960_c0_g1~~TRINITY_DN45960_c0_g1_i1.p1  ORF type:complete len:860 (-),score=97.76 TRINITY_DN45960_c0_g1_i1:226-2805(-)
MVRLLRIGDNVLITGMGGAADGCLDGKHGRISSGKHAHTGCYDVVVQGVGIKCIEESNLIELKELTYKIHKGRDQYRRTHVPTGCHGKALRAKIADALHSINQQHSVDGKFQGSDHHILFFDHETQELRGLLLPQDLEKVQIQHANLSQSLDYAVFPKSGRLVFTCDAAKTMYSVCYHVFGRAAPCGAQNLGTTANAFFGDLLSLAMTSDRLSLKSGWCSETIEVHAELELLVCPCCNKPAHYVCECQRISYCISACQKNDWKRHKILCKQLRSKQDNEPEQDSVEEPKPCITKDDLRHLLSLIEDGTWHLAREFFSLTRRATYLAHGILTSSIILDRIADCIADARGQKRTAVAHDSLMILSCSLHWVAQSYGKVISDHPRLLPELIGLLSIQDSPRSDSEDIKCLWQAASQVFRSCSPKKLVQVCQDTSFLQILLELMCKIESNFAALESRFGRDLDSWMQPVMLWGVIALCPRRHALFKANPDLISTSTLGMLGRIVHLMSSCEWAVLDVGAVDMWGTFQALYNWSYSPEIDEDTGASLGPTYVMQKWMCDIEVRRGRTNAGFIYPIDSAVPIHWIWSKKYECCACFQTVDTPLMCGVCGKTPYCSLECLEKNETWHRLFCNADEHLSPSNGASLSANASVSESFLQGQKVAAIGSSQSSSHISSLSLISAGDNSSRCFRADAILKIPGERFMRAADLKSGSIVQAASGGWVKVESLEIISGQEQNMVSLQTVSASLAVTATHRVMARRIPCPQTVPASGLKIGDSVLVGGGTCEVLINVEFYKAIEDVVQIVFVPDEAVEAFCPLRSGILSKGHGFAQTRRSQKKKTKRQLSDNHIEPYEHSMPDTNSSWIYRGR